MTQIHSVRLTASKKGINLDEFTDLYLNGDSLRPNGYTVEDLRRKYGIPSKTLYRWIEAMELKEKKEAINLASSQKCLVKIADEMSIERAVRTQKLFNLQNAILEKTISAVESCGEDPQKFLNVMKALGGVKVLETINGILERINGVGLLENKKVNVPDNWEELPSDELKRIVEEAEVIDG